MYKQIMDVGGEFLYQVLPDIDTGETLDVAVKSHRVSTTPGMVEVPKMHQGRTP